MSSWRRFDSEAALCQAFIAWAAAQGWACYPETHGWDMLLVGVSGVQFGVQAKQTANVRLLYQALPRSRASTGPTYRGILLPRYANDIGLVAASLGLTYFYPTGGEFSPAPLDKGAVDWGDKPLELPEFVPDVVAGAPAPRRLTPWKIKALRLCLLLERNGSVTSADFTRLGIDKRRWVACRWVVATAERGRYVRGELLEFDRQHPTIMEQLRQEH